MDTPVGGHGKGPTGLAVVAPCAGWPAACDLNALTTFARESCGVTVASAPATFRVGVWQIMSGTGPRGAAIAAGGC